MNYIPLPDKPEIGGNTITDVAAAIIYLAEVLLYIEKKNNPENEKTN